MLERMKTLAAAALAAAVLMVAAAQAAGAVTIADLAPKDSALVVGCDDWPGMRSSLDKSGLGQLWHAPEVQTFIRKVFEDQMGKEGQKQFTDWLDELDIDKEDLSEPTGAVGAAAFLRAKAPAKGDAGDEEDGQKDAAGPTVQVLAMADFGDKFKGNEAALEKMLDDLEDKGHIKVDLEDYGDVTIRVIKVVTGEDGADHGGSDGPINFESFKTLHVAGVKNILLVSTQMEALQRAIDRLEGEEEESVSGEQTFHDAMAQHPAKPQIYGVFIFNDSVRKAISDATGGGAMLPIPLPGGEGKLAEALGLTAIRAVSAGLSFDTPEAMSSQTFGLLMNEKKGLFALFDKPLGRFVPPPFVGPDATSAMRLSVQFDQIIPTARTVLAELPQQAQQQLGPTLDMLDQAYGPLLKSLGPDVYIVQSYERPFAADSQRTLTAVRAGDAPGLINALAPLIAQGGLEARDFQGNQIYEAPGGEGIGVGFGYLFSGKAKDIENAMRLAATPEGPQLATEDNFVRASADLAKESVICSFSDIRQTIDYAYWKAENFDKLWQAHMDELQLDEDMRKMFEQMAPTKPDWLDSLPPKELIMQHLGDSILEIKSTTDGFRGRSIILRPANQG